MQRSRNAAKESCVAVSASVADMKVTCDSARGARLDL